MLPPLTPLEKVEFLFLERDEQDSTLAVINVMTDNIFFIYQERIWRNPVVEIDLAVPYNLIRNLPLRKLLFSLNRTILNAA